MAECNPPPSSFPSGLVADSDNINNCSSVDEVGLLECLSEGKEKGEDVTLLENLSAESGTGAIVDSEVLDSVIQELCGYNPVEGESKKYPYLTAPPNPKKGPVSSFCRYVGGSFNREPEHMFNVETGNSSVLTETSDL